MITIKTTTLQRMLQKVSKGSRPDRLVDYSLHLGIEYKEGKLTLTYTDGTNFIEVSETIQGDDFKVTVSTDLFTKLTQKTTSENITLSITDRSLSFEGDGKYEFELPLDPETGLMVYPNFPEVESDNGNIVKLSTIQSIIQSNKTSLAVTFSRPYLTGYYLAQTSVATNSLQIAINTLPTFNQPFLARPQVLEMLLAMDTDPVAFRNDNKMWFITDNVKIYTMELENIEGYHQFYGRVNNHINSEFQSNCKVYRSTLLKTLDRLTLFLGKYTNKDCRLTFTAEGFKIESKDKAGSELLPYVSSDNFRPFSNCVKSLVFKNIISSQVGDDDIITIDYGHSDMLKISSQNVIHIIPFTDDKKQPTKDDIIEEERYNQDEGNDEY